MIIIIRFMYIIIIIIIYCTVSQQEYVTKFIHILENPICNTYHVDGKVLYK